MTRLGWLLINAAQATFVLAWCLIWIPLALLVRVVSRSANLPLAMARRIWAPGILAVGGVRVVVLGLEHLDPARPAMLVANHQSQMDIPALFEALPVPLRFLVKEELRHVPFLGWYIAAMDMVFIDRRNRTAAVDSMSRLTGRLRDGGHFLAFPEGSRSRDGRLQPFKSGTFLSPIEAGVDVLPVALAGADRVLPRGTLNLRPGRIRIAIGAPVPTAGLEPSQRRQLAEELESRVRDLLAGLEAANATNP